jgi:hypothetical protein
MPLNTKNRLALGFVSLHWVYGVVAIIFLSFKILDGFLRWAFGMVGLGPLVYLPVAASLGVLAVHCVVKLSEMRSPIFAVFGFMIVSVFAGVGIFMFGVPKQVAFGIYVFTPLMFGIVAYQGFFTRYQHHMPTMALVSFIVIALGALLDVQFALPWSGFSFEVGGEEIQGARAWTTHGLERVAGFSRASYSLAKQAIIAALAYIAFGSNTYIKLAVWFAALAVIAVTTTKGVLVAWLCLTLYFVGKRFLPSILIRLLPLSGVFVGILLPALSYFFDFSNLFKNNIILKIALGSFQTRLVQTWPNALEMINHHGSWLIGRGIGGIGTPQVGKEAFYSPGDNMYVYFFGIMGMLSFALYVPWLWQIWKLKIYQFKDDHFFFLISVLVFIYGITTGVVEDPFIAFFLGLSLAHLFQVHKAHDTLA